MASIGMYKVATGVSIAYASGIHTSQIRCNFPRKRHGVDDLGVTESAHSWC